MTTSFKKKSNSRGRPNLPPGTKVSLLNNQLLISTGVPSLDSLIGGGLPVGTILLLEEDIYSSYANVLQRLFLAEGVENNQELFVASADINPNDILKEIPSNALATDEPQETEEDRKHSENDDLKIAWRYQNKPKVSTDVANYQFGHYFDLSKTILEEKLKNVKCTCFNPKVLGPSENVVNSKFSINNYYRRLLKKIQEKINDGYSTSSASIPPILRISISSLGSSFWNETLLTRDEYDPSLAWFLMSLKSILRKAYAACFLTMPTHLFEDESYVARLKHCCDIVIKLDSFAGSDKEQNPLYKEYHGLFYVRSQKQLNCITGQNIDTTDLAFKLKRKKFSIEKLHLPPDISETASRSHGNTSSLKPGVPLCSATTPVNNLLEF